MKEICLVVPTIRENCLVDFMKRWASIGLFESVDLLVMEDNPSKTFEIPEDVKKLADITHVSWEDIKTDLGDKEWIIPRRSDTVRSYAYWKAWKLGYKYILTLDDDCYPATEEDGLTYTGQGFVSEHLKNLNNRSRWFNTLNSVKPRGIPFYNVGTMMDRIIVNHGLWTKVLDYDAPYQLANPIKEQFSFDNRVVPAGLYFPMCGMNVMWRSYATVLMYHLLMGQKVCDQPDAFTVVNGVQQPILEKLPFDRFGDIWCGILMKKVADHMRLTVTTGMPYIRHERASNPFANLKKEANGIEVNEKLWEFVDRIDLTKEQPSTLEACYYQLGKAITTYNDFPEHAAYFKRLGEAMMVWADLFKAEP